METTDRRDFGGKPSRWRWGLVLSWKIPEFYSLGGARSKKNISRVFRVPWLSCVQPIGISYTPRQWYRWKAETLRACLCLS